MSMKPAMALPQGGAIHARRWPAMFALLAANFMTVMDVSIVNLGLPNLQADLAADPRDLQWVVLVYVLAYGIGLLPFARMGDIVGRRVVVLAGMVAFLAASAGCGAAPTVGSLIVLRALQGLGAAMMSSQVMAIAQTMFHGPERARVGPLFGLAGGLSGIAGPIVAGLLLHANYFGWGWRLLYVINVPVGLVALAAAVAWVPVCPPHPGLKSDKVGIVLSAVAILCLIYPLAQGRLQGWPVGALLMLAASLPLTAAFLQWERRQENAGRSTLFPVYLLRHRDYLMGAIAILAFFSALQGFFLVLALYLQQGLSFSPLQAGLSNVPFPLGIILATTWAGRFGDLRTRLLGGLGVLLALFAAVAWLGGMARPGTLTPLHLAMPMLVFGVASGLCISSLFQTVMRTVPLHDAGAGLGAIQVVQQVGGGVGIALMSAIFFGGAGTHAAAGVGGFNLAFTHAVIYVLVAYVMAGAAVLSMRFELPAHMRRAV